MHITVLDAIYNLMYLLFAIYKPSYDCLNTLFEIEDNMKAMTTSYALLLPLSLWLRLWHNFHFPLNHGNQQLDSFVSTLKISCHVDAQVLMVSMSCFFVSKGKGI